MAYVPVPKDLNSVKTKVLFNLTKRQLICLGIGLGLSLPAFFLCKSFMGTSGGVIVMIVVLLPFLLFAMYEKNGMPLEKILRDMIQVCFIRSKTRPYETNNFYDLLSRQDALDKEVYRIVSKNKAVKDRQKDDTRGNRKSEKTGQKQEKRTGQHTL